MPVLRGAIASTRVFRPSLVRQRLFSFSTSPSQFFASSFFVALFCDAVSFLGEPDCQLSVLVNDRSLAPRFHGDLPKRRSGQGVDRCGHRDRLGQRFGIPERSTGATRFSHPWFLQPDRCVRRDVQHLPLLQRMYALHKGRRIPVDTVSADPSERPHPAHRPRSVGRQAVLDRAPVVPGQHEQSLGRGVSATQGGHTVGKFHARLTVDGAFAADLADLAGPRPVEITGQARRGPQRAAFDATATFPDRAGRLLLRLTLALGVGGPCDATGGPLRRRPVPARFPAVMSVGCPSP